MPTYRAEISQKLIPDLTNICCRVSQDTHAGNRQLAVLRCLLASSADVPHPPCCFSCACQYLSTSAKTDDDELLVLSVSAPPPGQFRRYRFEVEAGTQIGKLREKLSKLSYFRVWRYQQQRLAFFSGDTELNDDSRTLASYGVQQNAQLRTERIDTRPPPPPPRSPPPPAHVDHSLFQIITDFFEPGTHHDDHSDHDPDAELEADPEEVTAAAAAAATLDSPIDHDFELH